MGNGSVQDSVVVVVAVAMRSRRRDPPTRSSSSGMVGTKLGRWLLCSSTL